MRTLLLLRGSAGCGKSTWIEKNGLKQYTLSADDIRLMCSSPVMDVSGKEQISQANDRVVWELLYQILELRMKNGEFTVIDATNSKTTEINRYKKLCEFYRYRIYCVDFSDIPIEVTKERNLKRPEVKQVPEEVIDKMYARLETQKIPSGVTVIKPDELEKVWVDKVDLLRYDKIHVIGDIHGCNTVLQHYLGGGLNDNEFYIFVGDYIDRGVENTEVINYLLSIYKKENVCLLEGNHEKWLRDWAYDKIVPSKEFEFITKTEIEKEGISKKDVRNLCRRFAQCAYFSYGDYTYIVTHGGLSNIPQNLTFISAKQMIHGVGSYPDCEIVEDSFVKNTPDNFIQIHGHRNVKQLPIKSNKRCFNLEGRVEFGGYLRCMTISKDGTQQTFEVKNDIFKKPEINNNQSCKDFNDVGNLIMELRQNKYIREQSYGDISSFNFTKKAFEQGVWDDQTTKARGLYINIPKRKIIARSYDKFFNINERPETKLENLSSKLVFPVTAYVKENGFLGIVSYNEKDDSLFITTKSSPNSEHANWFEQILREKLSAKALNSIKTFAKNNNVSFIFECVDMADDPHIIDYGSNQLFLLDIVYNNVNYNRFSFESLRLFARVNNIVCKEKAYILNTWQDFFDWYYVVKKDDYTYNGRHIEGFVIEDSDGFMTKLKLSYYNFWKFMRSISNEVFRKGYIDGNMTSRLTTDLSNYYYGWIKEYRDSVLETRMEIPKDICSLRKIFYKQCKYLGSNEF